MTSSRASFQARVNEDFDKPAPLPPRGAPQSRFIPREELEGFAAWRPGSFGGTGAPTPSAKLSRHRSTSRARNSGR